MVCRRVACASRLERHGSARLGWFQLGWPCLRLFSDGFDVMEELYGMGEVENERCEEVDCTNTQTHNPLSCENDASEQPKSISHASAGMNVGCRQRPSHLDTSKKQSSIPRTAILRFDVTCWRVRRQQQ